MKDVQCYELSRGIALKNHAFSFFEPSNLVSEIAAPQVHGEKLVKPAITACANEVLGKDAASTLSTTTL